MLQAPKPQAQVHIRRAINQVSGFISWDPSLEAFVLWRRDTTIAIASAFGQDSQQVREFNEINFGGFETGRGTPFDITTFHSGLSISRGILRSMLNEMELNWQDNRQPQPNPQSHEIGEQQMTNRVFVVHGRDEGTRSIVARFLESLKLEAIILQEQANEGRTVIEKFEDYADVGFAVVLCTPDDIGKLDAEGEELRPRPRQNVVLEWGFFLGSLRRNRVCALLKGDVEIPSDYAGVVYIKLDESEGWRTQLAIELQRAGLPVDLNDLNKTR